jgi:serine protease Do
MSEYKQPGNKNKFASYMAAGLIGSVVGGTVLTTSAVYVLPETQFFKNTPLYQSIAGKPASASSVTNTAAPAVTTTAAVNTASTAAPASSSTAAGLSVTEIVKKVGPAVVGISTYQNSTLYAEGTGIIFSSDGYIITNYHVISSGNNYKITLSNNKKVTANVVNYDSSLDLAVLKITDKVQVPGVAEFGDSDKLQVGELAVAIGNPLGLELSNSVTAGVISAVNRQLSNQSSQTPNQRMQSQQSDTPTETFIQTDAAINEGNSGGPLINSQGQVIGINSSKIGGTGVEGLGFAIPVNVVKAKVQDLLKPMLTLGISTIDINQVTASVYNLPVGIYIKSITSGSAAENSGLKTGDIITKFDGTSVKTITELNTLKAKHNSGDTVKIEVYRNGKTVSLNLKLEASIN